MSFAFFWKPDGPYGFLSNWSAHGIRDEGLRFKTMEHYMMYSKAILMDDSDTASRILSAKTPYAAKKLGREVRNFNEDKWRLQRESIVHKGLTMKVDQHPDVKRQLIGTFGKVLAEASPYDTTWGIGLAASDERANNQEHWRGENLLGKIWMQVREKLLLSEC